MCRRSALFNDIDVLDLKTDQQLEPLLPREPPPRQFGECIGDGTRGERRSSRIVTSTTTLDSRLLRDRLVEVHLTGPGISDSRGLDALRCVPRVAFVRDVLAEFACEDAPLPLGQSQPTSQPYIVAPTVQALALRGGEPVLRRPGGRQACDRTAVLPNTHPLGL